MEPLSPGAICLGPTRWVQMAGLLGKASISRGSLPRITRWGRERDVSRGSPPWAARCWGHVSHTLAASRRVHIYSLSSVIGSEHPSDSITESRDLYACHTLYCFQHQLPEPSFLSLNKKRNPLNMDHICGFLFACPVSQTVFLIYSHW